MSLPMYDLFQFFMTCGIAVKRNLHYVLDTQHNNYYGHYVYL